MNFVDLIATRIGLFLLVLVVLYYCWEYVLAFLAICGAIQLFHTFRRAHSRKHN